MNRSYFQINIKGKKYALSIKRSGGHLDHYYHFIIDFLWPLYEWSLNYVDFFNSNSSIHTLDPNAKKFSSITQQLLGMTIRKHPLASKLFNVIELPVKNKIHGFNPNYDDYLKTFNSINDFQKSHRKFIDSVFTQLKLSESDEPLILLIERKSPNGSSDDRRVIKNHQQLQIALSKFAVTHNITLKNLSLSQMQFRDQVQLFYNSNLIIGQHGAGLINLLWMNRKRGMLIELEGTKNRRHFENLCNQLDFNYCKVIGESRLSNSKTEELLIDVDKLIALVDKHFASQKFK